MPDIPKTVQRWVDVVRDAGGNIPVSVFKEMTHPLGPLALLEVVRTGLVIRKGHNLFLVKE